jgi:muramidase (phage lysozyme)
MTNEVKSLLDMISYSEGTLGISNNGYDVLVGGRVIQGWSETTNITHLNRQWYNSSANSTAAGRYQFLYKSWVEVNGSNVPMTKAAQDIAAAKQVVGRLNGLDSTKFRNYANFSEGCDKLARIWASIPLSKDIVDKDGVLHRAGKSYYSSDGINKSKSSQKLFDVFISALNIYEGK